MPSLKVICLFTIVGFAVLGPSALAGPPVTLVGPAPEAVNGPYVPPACTGLFADVACPGGFAVNWIEQFYNDGITAGCGTGVYCPDNPVTRAQMAVFVEKAMRGTANWPPHTQLVWAVKNADGTPNPSASGSALLAAVAAIPTVGNDVPSGTNPWLVKVGPGIYDIGSGSLTLPAYTSLEGSGQEATTVTAAGYADTTHGTVVMGFGGRLSRLTVANTGGNSYEIAVYIPPSTPGVVLEHLGVTASNPSNTSGATDGVYAESAFSAFGCAVAASGASSNFGIFAPAGGGSLTLDAVTIDVDGASATGVTAGLSANGAATVMTNSRVTVSDGLVVYGVYAVGYGTLELRDSYIYAVNGSTAGVYLDSVSGRLVGDLLDTNAGSGVRTGGSGGSLTISACHVGGASNWLNNGAGYTVTAGASMLRGATAGAGTTHCYGNYTAAGFYSNTCP